MRNGGLDWHRMGILAFSILSALVVTAGAGAGALLLVAQQSIERVELPPGVLQTPEDLNSDGEVTADEMEEVHDVLNLLVVGSDSREGLTDAQLQALGTEDVGTNLTDTVMLVQLDPDRDGAVVLSFPRDLMVERCDGTRFRINEAYQIGENSDEGGAACLIETVKNLTGIPIDHFVRVNLAGFIDVVDAVGGVSFYLDQPLRDDFAGVDLDAGCVTLDGTEALGFVRSRHVDNDFGRIARQQRFIRELVRKATSAGTLLQPQRLFGLVRSVARTLETDQNLGLPQMQRIAYSVRDISAEGINMWAVPGTERTTSSGAFVIEPDMEQAERLFVAFREGTLIPEDVGREPPAPVTIADVPPLVVLNGAGVEGLADEMRAALEERGFAIAETGNADRVDVARSEVVYPPDRLDEAELVSEALGGAPIVEGEPGEDLAVVVGSRFNRFLLPSPAPTETPTPTATPTSTDSPSPTPSFPTDARDSRPLPPPPPTPEPEPTFRGAADSDVQC